MRELKPCGTVVAYLRHLKRKEEPCALCRRANADHSAKYPEVNRRSNRKYDAKRRSRANTPEEKARRAEEAARRYGLTVASKMQMIADQGGVCAICRTDRGGYRGWHVDHDHALGLKAVRGILCDRCNRCLGMMGDTLESVSALNWVPAIAYLIRARDRFIARGLLVMPNTETTIDTSMTQHPSGAGRGQEKP